MSCCGRQRQALRMDAVHRVAAAPRPPAAPTDPVRLEHRGNSAIVVRGSHSGLTYLFGPSGESLDVDGRDAPALLRSGSFQRA